jgi:VanZ family protein
MTAPSPTRRRIRSVLRWSAALVWTALVLYLMLSPGKDSTADDLSRSFGGTDLSDAVGHVILYGVLTILWDGALQADRPGGHRLALMVGLALGLLGESLQVFVPYRGVALLDFAANLAGVFLGSGLARRLPQLRPPGRDRQ